MNNIAKWNGTSWMPVGNGTDGDVLSFVCSMDHYIYSGNFLTQEAILLNGMAYHFQLLVLVLIMT